MDARRLFHAVVVTGAALTACGSESAPRTPDEGAAPDGSAAGTADGAAPADASGGALPDAAPATDGAAKPDDAGADAACPPDAESPVPPCYLIR